MQTKSISVGEEYAKSRRRYGEPEQMLRFRVAAIVTRKERGQSYSKIEGWIVEDQPLNDEGQRVFDPKEIVSCSPEDLIGPFQENKELFDRRQAEIAAREAVEKAHEANCKKLHDLLYEKTGIARPEDIENPKSWDLPYRNSRSRIEITRGGVLPLIAVLERL